MTATDAADRLQGVAEYAPNQHVIDLEAIRNNTREIRRAIGHECVFYAALKGNAYGHGLVPAGRAVLEGGADGLSMVHLRDAIQLREAGITDVPILLYCGNLGHPGSVELVEHYDVTTTLVDAESIEMYERLAKDKIKVWLEVDTGLERLGCADDDAVALAKRIDASPKLSLEGVYTHLNSDGQYSKQQLEPTDAEVHPFIQWQFDRFTKVLADIAAAGIDPKVTLAASSPVVRLTSTMNLTGVDVGRLLYGIIPVVPPGVDLGLRPGFHSLTSRLLQVKPVDRTEYVEWADFDVYEGMTIGVIPMGYGDGLALLTTEEVLVRGKRVPIIGKHFEHARLDLTGCPEAQPGDEVIVIGKQGDDEITLKDVATHQNFGKAAGLGSLVRETIPKVYIN